MLSKRLWTQIYSSAQRLLIAWVQPEISVDVANVAIEVGSLHWCSSCQAWSWIYEDSFRIHTAKFLKHPRNSEATAVYWNFAYVQVRKRTMLEWQAPVAFPMVMFNAKWFLACQQISDPVFMFNTKCVLVCQQSLCREARIENSDNLILFPCSNSRQKHVAVPKETGNRVLLPGPKWTSSGCSFAQFWRALISKVGKNEHIPSHIVSINVHHRSKQSKSIGSIPTAETRRWLANDWIVCSWCCGPSVLWDLGPICSYPACSQAHLQTKSSL